MYLNILTKTFYLIFKIGNFPSNPLANILEKSSLFFTDQNGFRPDLIQISIKKLKNDADTSEVIFFVIYFLNIN